MGAPRVAGGEGSGGGCPGVRGGGGVGWGGGGGVEGVRARGCVPGVGGECVCVCGWVGGCPGGLGWRSGASGQCGAVWGQCLRAARWDRPALPWGLAGLALGPRGSPSSRASADCPASPVQGHSCPRGTATPSCPACLPACLVPARAQPRADAPGQPCAGASSGVAGRKAGARLQGHWAGGWRPEPRGIGGGRGLGSGPVGGLVREPQREPNGPGPLPPTRGLEGRSGRRGREPAGRCCSVHRGCPGRSPSRSMPAQQPRRGKEGPPPGGAPRACEQEGPGEAEALQAGGGLRPGKGAGCPQVPGLLLAGAPGGKPDQGLGSAPEAKGQTRGGYRGRQGQATPHSHPTPLQPRWSAQADRMLLPQNPPTHPPANTPTATRNRWWGRSAGWGWGWCWVFGHDPLSSPMFLVRQANMQAGHLGVALTLV